MNQPRISGNFGLYSECHISYDCGDKVQSYANIDYNIRLLPIFDSVSWIAFRCKREHSRRLQQCSNVELCNDARRMVASGRKMQTS